MVVEMVLEVKVSGGGYGFEEVSGGGYGFGEVKVVVVDMVLER